MNKNKRTPIIAVIAIGIVLGGLILTWGNYSWLTAAPGTTLETSESKDKPGAKGDTAASEPVQGPNGGKLFMTDGFGVEVTIHEKGVPPQFRLYLSKNGKPLPPAAAKVTLTLSRLGAPAQIFKFTPEAAYLLGDQVVEEPHSFDMAIAAEHNGKTFHWDHSQVEARVEMPDEMLQSIGVTILAAGPATIKPTLKLPGEIIFNPNSIVQVVPRVPGVAVAVNYEIGQQVRKGAVLAVIESQVLADLRGQYLVAKKRLALAQITYAREKSLWEEKITAKQDYLAAQQALAEAEIAAELALAKLHTLGVRSEIIYQERNLSRYEIRAPISGLITAKAVALGTALREDAAIFTVADMTTVWAEITLYPKDLGVIREGQAASVKATALDTQSTGVVSYISALVGMQTRTAKARMILDNSDGRWRPGTFVNAELVTEEIQVPVAVAADAIQTLDGRTVVFGRYGNYFEVRPLELGRSDGKMIEVLKGLSAGEQYAVGNSFAIKAELGKAGASHDH